MAYPIVKYFKNLDSFLKLLSSKSESFWLKRGEKHTLLLFSEVSKSVPAYKDFLKKNKIYPNSIKNISDFSKIPTTDKVNYLRTSDFTKLVPGGSFSKGNWSISATSGSTGEPFYFPRTSHQDLYYALTAELYLLTNFNIDKKKTLYINCFALGVWIGGIFTYQAIKHIQEKNKYNLTLINPGINKEEILKVLNKLGRHYDQVIIGGYPPFIKDFIDFSNEQKFDWTSISAKFIFSAEGFSEEFRDYIAKNANLKDIYKDTLNHYGTVDIGTKAYETPISILIRHLALKNKVFFKNMFENDERLPTLTQFIPEQFYFEVENNILICTSESGIPLIRYDLKDVGGVKKFSEVFAIAEKAGIDLNEEIKKAGIADTVWELPFVYIFERADFSISLYGANIYPETIKSLLINSFFRKSFSGRFSMQIIYSKKQNPRFVVHIELKKNNLGSILLKAKLEKAIFEKLKNENAEYLNNFKVLGKKIFPSVVFWPYESKKYFSRSGKHKWVVK